MKFETKIFLSRQKYYFDLGVGTTSFFIKVLAVVGISAAVLEMIRPTTLFILGVIYAIFCYFLGYFMVTYDWVTASIEVNNRLNRFVREMRESLQ